MVFSGFILSKIPYERAFPHTSSPYFPNRDISRTTWLGEEPEGGGGCSGCCQAGVLIMGRMTEMKVSRENLCKNLAMVRARAVFPTKCMLFKYSCISVSPPSIHNQPPKTAHPKHHHPDPLPTPVHSFHHAIQKSFQKQEEYPRGKQRCSGGPEGKAKSYQKAPPAKPGFCIHTPPAHNCNHQQQQTLLPVPHHHPLRQTDANDVAQAAAKGAGPTTHTGPTAHTNNRRTRRL